MNNIEFTYKDSLISWDKVIETSNTLSQYTKHLHLIADIGSSTEDKINYKEAESSVNLPFDFNLYKKVAEVAKKIDTENLKYIIVVGIGGSNLGTKAIYDGIVGTLDPFLSERIPKIIFADTVSPSLLEDIRTIIDKNITAHDEVLINVISKSGATTETIANFETIYSFFKNRFGDVKNRVVVTTDRDSRLWNKAKGYGFETLEIPAMIGGRYSVFSSVGLFPLVVAGFDVGSLLDGARMMRDECIKKDVIENPALTSAALIYLHNKAGVSIHNSFFFNPELESMGRWYRQLMGESIGKKFGFSGDEVNAGITPIVSIGSTDLHSMAQLYLGGPKDKFTTFVYAHVDDIKTSVPEDMLFPELVDGIKGREFSKIMDAIFGGVKESYKKNGLSFVEVRLPNMNEYTLGQFLQFKMLEMMYLAQLLGVNAFDQPNVEDYKRETRKILQEVRSF